MSSPSWRPPLAKLVGLLVALPFAATYLHLYHDAHWRNEYCFVGPHVSLIGGRPFGSPDDVRIANAAVAGGAVADNQLRGAATATAERAKSSDGDPAFAAFHGIYAPVTPWKKKKKDNNNLDRRQFRQVHSSSWAAGKSSSAARFWANGWPSATQASVAASSPSSQLSSRRRSRGEDASGSADRAMIAFVETDGGGGGRWCLRSSSSSTSTSDGGGDEWCSDPLPAYPAGTTLAYPPSGIWRRPVVPPPSSSSSAESVPALAVACPAPAAFPPKFDAGRHRGQNRKQNENVQFLVNHPATVLLMALNVGLAFHYWNHRINPGSVCKQYNKIVGEHEWWRGLTGATGAFYAVFGEWRGNAGVLLLGRIALEIEVEGRGGGG